MAKGSGGTRDFGKLGVTGVIQRLWDHDINRKQ